MVRLAAGAGLAAICQKPLAPTLAEAEALVAEVGATIPLMVHENWRFRPWYRALKGWIEAGRLGEIRQVHLDVLSSGMIPGPDGLRPAVVRQPFLTGLDRMLVAEMLIHQIDTLRYLLGEMRLVSARLWQSTPALKGEDIASVALQRPDGVPVTITANLAVPGAPPLPADRLRIIGSRAVARLDGARLTLTGPAPEDRGFDADAGYRGSYAATIAHFLDHLVDRRFETAPADNLRTLALVEAIYSGDNRAPAPGGGADDR
jgi:predicted dehydrogenase